MPPIEAVCLFSHLRGTALWIDDTDPILGPRLVILLQGEGWPTSICPLLPSRGPWAYELPAWQRAEGSLRKEQPVSPEIDTPEPTPPKPKRILTRGYLKRLWHALDHDTKGTEDAELLAGLQAMQAALITVGARTRALYPDEPL